MNVWLRSANRGNANNAWNVNNSGNVNNNNAYNANRGCPDCSAYQVTRPVHSIGTPIRVKEAGSRVPCRKTEQHQEDAAISPGDADRYHFKETYNEII